MSYIAPISGQQNYGGYRYYYSPRNTGGSVTPVPPVDPIKQASGGVSTEPLQYYTKSNAASQPQQPAPISTQALLQQYESDPAAAAVRMRLHNAENELARAPLTLNNNTPAGLEHTPGSTAANPLTAAAAAGSAGLPGAQAADKAANLNMPGAEKAAEAPAIAGAEDAKSAQEVMNEGECQTCKNRKYQDGSDDPGVSFKTPTKIDPDMAASVVRGHEMEHVVRERAAAEREDREVVQQSVVLHSAICPECGESYVSGGTTTTTTRADQSEQQRQQQQEQQQAGFFEAVA